jgi:UDP-N-acetylglucosamine--dolichyl-phosphate N-acetylglucosaminephosphotransferase
MWIHYVGIVVLSFLVTFILSHFLVPRLKRFGITGKDVNKPDRPVVAEMGGIAIVAGFSAGLLLAIFFNSFIGLEFNLIFVLAALIAILSVSFMGMVDDLLDIPQWLKALLPLFAAIPLVAVKAVGSTAMNIPFLGLIDFGIFYIVLLIPLGIAVSSNLTNMLAGFNGMESGMGIIIFAVMGLIALVNGSVELALISLAMLGALLAFMKFNWFPAKVFPGDVGNLTIGAALASGVIIGNIESAGAILMIPYCIDFFIKAINRFPSSNWWGTNINGKLFAPEDKVRGFAQLVMKKFNGITERKLVLFFIGLEAVFGLIVLLLFLKL